MLDPALLFDVTRFTDAIAEGNFRRYRRWNPESIYQLLVDDFLSLLKRTQRVHEQGDEQRALRAYEMLLCGTRKGGGLLYTWRPPLLDVVGRHGPIIDRYLGLYLKYIGSDPAAALSRKMLEVFYRTSRKSTLSGVLSHSGYSSADVLALLPTWLLQLRKLRKKMPSLYYPYLDMLRKEAWTMLANHDSGESVLEATDMEQPSILLDLMAVQLRKGRRHSALETAMKALSVLEGKQERLQLAEILAAMARDFHEPEMELVALREAWRTQPTLLRLRDLCWSQAGEQERVERLVDELEALEDHRLDLPPPFVPMLEVLAGDYESPAIRVEESLNRQEHSPFQYLFGLFLFIGSGLKLSPGQSAMNREWAGFAAVLPSSVVGHPGRVPRNADVGFVESVLLSGLPASKSTSVAVRRKLLSDLFLSILRRHPPSREQRRRYRGLCRQISSSLVQEIVSSGDRMSYHLAARTVVACQEVCYICNSHGEGDAFMCSQRSAFPRHRAFHGELDKLVGSSSVLNPSSGGVPSRVERANGRGAG